MIVSQSPSGYAWLCASCVMCKLLPTGFGGRRKPQAFNCHDSRAGANGTKIEVQQTVINNTSEHTK